MCPSPWTQMYCSSMPIKFPCNCPVTADSSGAIFPCDTLRWGCYGGVRTILSDPISKRWRRDFLTHWWPAKPSRFASRCWCICSFQDNFAKASRSPCSPCWNKNSKVHALQRQHKLGAFGSLWWFACCILNLWIFLLLFALVYMESYSTLQLADRPIGR